MTTTKTLNLIGEYRLEGAELYKEGAEPLHLKTGVRHKTRRGVGMRYIGKMVGEEFKYISSLYPTGKKNIFSLDYDGEKLELEIISENEVIIRQHKVGSLKLALVFQEVK